MDKNRNGDAIVAESFLEVRAKLLEVAATLDRIDRASELTPLGDEAGQKRALLGEAVNILLADDQQRAARLQQLFSREYESDWRQQFGISAN